MLTLSQLAPFLAAVALIELTPGPNMAYLFVVSSRSGRAAGMVTVAGITLGLSIYLAVTLAGLGEVLRWPWVLALLRWGGVAYLVWLAIDTWRAGDRAAGADAGRNEAMPPPARLFLRGLMNNVLNPKNAVFYLVLLPGFVEPEAGNATGQALHLGLIHLAVSVGVHSLIVLGGDRAGRAAGALGATAWPLERLFALALLAVAAWLALPPP